MFWRKNNKQKQLPAPAAVDAAEPKPITDREYQAKVMDLKTLLLNAPKPIQDMALACLTMHAKAYSKRDLLNDEAQYIFNEILNSYLPDILNQLERARLADAADEIADGTYTAAQICEQSLKMLHDKLQSMLEEQANSSGAKIVVNRNFLAKRLGVMDLPTPSAAEQLALPKPPEPEPVTLEQVVKEKAKFKQRKKISAPKVYKPSKGDKVNIDLVRMVDEWPGGLDNFCRDWSWKIDRDYKAGKVLTGRVVSVEEEHFDGKVAYLCEIDVARHGRISGIDAYYLTCKTPTANRKRDFDTEKLPYIDTIKPLTREQEAKVFAKMPELVRDLSNLKHKHDDILDTWRWAFNAGDMGEAARYAAKHREAAEKYAQVYHAALTHIGEPKMNEMLSEHAVRIQQLKMELEKMKKQNSSKAQLKQSKNIHETLRKLDGQWYR